MKKNRSIGRQEENRVPRKSPDVFLRVRTVTVDRLLLASWERIILLSGVVLLARWAIRSSQRARQEANSRSYGLLLYLNHCPSTERVESRYSKRRNPSDARCSAWGARCCVDAPKRIPDPPRAAEARYSASSAPERHGEERSRQTGGHKPIGVKREVDPIV